MPIFKPTIVDIFDSRVSKVTPNIIGILSSLCTKARWNWLDS